MFSIVSKADLVGEAHRVPDQPADARAEFVGHRGYERAAIRRGVGVSDQALDPSAQLQAQLGSCVLFPEPVSPATITTWLSAIAASNSSRRSVIGRSSG